MLFSKENINSNTEHRNHKYVFISLLVISSYLFTRTCERKKIVMKILVGLEDTNGGKWKEEIQAANEGKEGARRK